MTTKLTLSIDKAVISKAKEYAKEHNVSLSYLVENYLSLIVEKLKETPEEKGSIVTELSGIINLDTNADYEDEHTQYLIEKYK